MRSESFFERTERQKKDIINFHMNLKLGVDDKIRIDMERQQDD